MSLTDLDHGATNVVDNDQAQGTVYLPPRIKLPESSGQQQEIPSELEIRSLIEEQIDEADIEIEEDLYTPKGNLRAQPMYLATIENEYLGKIRNLKKSSPEELLSAACEQICKWGKQELAERLSQRVNALNEQAAEENKQVTEILQQGLLDPPEIDWTDYRDDSSPPAFTFRSPPPEPLYPTTIGQPQKGLLGMLFPAIWRAYLRAYRTSKTAWKAQCRELKLAWEEEFREWELERTQAKDEHASRVRQHKLGCEQTNVALEHFLECLDAGNSNATIRYLEEVFKYRRHPKGFNVSHTVGFERHSGTAIIDLLLPDPPSVPDVIGYRFVKSTGMTKVVSMKPAEFAEFYDSAVKQTVLRTIHEAFASDTRDKLSAVVVNGWVSYIEQSTGRDATSCIISVSVDREVFSGLDLSRVTPSECIKNLKGLMAGPLSKIAPVQPIMYLNRDDSRFVDNRDVLSDLGDHTNLAEIGWEEFEHLIRELFGKMFSTEDAEVKVTQSSSDGGVDAIAFDSDPIRGGKFVIQAKRYANVVPVSAVRDLYGTMISEGAVKGILVTTSHFGSAARQFVKDKPISLVDGTNLVYLLEKHGYRMRVDIDAVRSREDWNPLAR
jgi:restriction system protein